MPPGCSSPLRSWPVVRRRVMRWSPVRLVGPGLALTVACGPPATVAPPSLDAPDPVPPGAVELRRDLLVLASDSFRGRETGTPDERRAAEFLASRAAATGLSPAGDSGYIQRIPLTRTTVGSGTRFILRDSHGETHTLTGLRPLLELGPDLPPMRRHAEGAIVFAGFGLERPGNGDDLAHVPIAGRVVVVVNGAPSTSDATRRAALESPASIAVRLQRILPLHPAAVIMLLTGASADVYESAAGSLARGALRAADATDGQRIAASGPASETPLVVLGLPTRGSPLLPPHWPRDDRPQPLHVQRLTATVDVEERVIESYNVVATI